MKRKSFAKVNLALDVVKRQANGYHELDMIMAPIDLFDTIEIKIHPTMEFTCNKPYLPWDQRNSIYQAITLIKDTYQLATNFSVRLMKNIPSRGGLGGGSSNAALTLRMLNELLDLKISSTELAKLGLKLGADVPFCLYGQPARVQGIGEKLIPIKQHTSFWIFLAKPNLGISTKEAFKLLDVNQISHPAIDQVALALAEADYPKLLATIGNSLENSAIQLGLPLTAIKNDLLSIGFDQVVMSGSGSTVLAFTQSEKLVDQAMSHYFLKFSLVKKTKLIPEIFSVEVIN